MTAEGHLRAKISRLYIFNNTNDAQELRKFRIKVLEAMDSYATDRLDSYKESLRSAIAVTNSPNGDDYFMDGYEQGLLKAMELIDTVTPKE